jgi:alpha-beta hydrolase superfamily lysophospholipase
MTVTRKSSEHTFRSHDGIEIFYRRWPAVHERRGCVLLLHRGHEHSGRVAHLADELDLGEFDVVAWDSRGHGRSAGERGDARDTATLVRDLESFVRHLRQEHAIHENDIALVAQSLAAVVVATWLHDYAPQVRCAVLASPAFEIKLYVPFARLGLDLASRMIGNFSVKSYVTGRQLTRDRERQASYDSDPLISRAISVRLLLDVQKTSARVVQDAFAIVAPVQLLISGSDWVVRPKAQHDFFANLGSTRKEKHTLPGLLHDTLGDLGRGDPIAKARSFILAQFATPFEPFDWRRADRQGPTHSEAARLATPFAANDPRGWFWSAYRGFLRWAANFSEGIAIGQAHGFDSGASLDYVYCNQAQGKGPVGRFIDRQYLQAIGWRGIRQRKKNLEALLVACCAKLEAEGREVHILDIAAGHGRYVLDAVAEANLRPASIQMRDVRGENVESGRVLILERGLHNIARFDLGDAFDVSSLARVQPKATVAIVSGLYELFSDNDEVSQSLAGVARACENGAYLIYTCQPWHPQLELIARALTSHRHGEAWVMRRRAQAEMDQLVCRAGFEKVDERIDEHGIFTVSVARRVML